MLMRIGLKTIQMLQNRNKTMRSLKWPKLLLVNVQNHMAFILLHKLFIKNLPKVKLKFKEEEPMKEPKDMTNEELKQENARLIKIYNSSRDPWHHQCLNEHFEELEEIAAERGIEL
nr:MAG TPA: hypothetical protein [Caudoviricetes sp.]